MAKYNLSEAERKRRSELAKQLHQKRDPVTGRPLLGGPQPGSGRPRKRRATEIINERVEEHADEIFERILKVLRSRNDFASLKAAQQMIDVSKQETEFQMREERNLEETPTEELIELITSRMVRLAEGGHIPDFDVEGTAVEAGFDELDAGEGEVNESERLIEPSAPSSGFGKAPFARRTAE